jgi:hypothetical protein
LFICGNLNFLLVAQLCSSLDAALLVCTGSACARSYISLSFCNAAAAGGSDLDLASLAHSSQSIQLHDRRRPRLPSHLVRHAADAMSSTACISDMCRAAMRARVSVMECFCIFDRPYTAQIQEESHSSSNDRALIGVHDHVLSDQAVSAALMHSGSTCHLPLVAPNRRLLHSSVLQLKIW